MIERMYIACKSTDESGFRSSGEMAYQPKVMNALTRRALDTKTMAKNRFKATDSVQCTSAAHGGGVNPDHTLVIAAKSTVCTADRAAGLFIRSNVFSR